MGIRAPNLLAWIGAGCVALSMGALVVHTSGCIAFVCFDNQPCASASGGAGGAGTGSTSTNESTTTSTATSTTGTMGATGSTGSGIVCGNPSKCDGIDCLGGACDNCICEPVALDLGVPVGRVAVGDNVYFVEKAMTGAKLVSVPKTFDPAQTTPTLLTALPDGDGFVAASSTNVAYSHHSDGHLTFCNSTQCQPTPDTLAANPNGIAFDGNDVFFTVAGASPEVDNYAFAVPPGNAKFPPTNESPGSGQGPHTLRVLSSDIYWTDYDGCLYAEPDQTVGSTNCLGSSLNAADLAVSPTIGVFVAQTSGAELYRVVVNVQGSSETAGFIKDDQGTTIQATAPIAADTFWFYVSKPSAQGPGIDVYKYVSTGSPKIMSFTTAQALDGMDATDPNLLFFTADQKLYRWAKPPKT